jgi:hypothetical protein
MDERWGGDVAMAFLAALEARDLGAAKALLAPGAVMIFPGGARFETLEQLIEWAAPRYRWVKKTHDHVEALAGDEGGVVYVRGTLFGEWPDGTPFEGIRYIDRFEIADGRITKQDVWNDMGEARG